MNHLRASTADDGRKKLQVHFRSETLFRAVGRGLLISVIVAAPWVFGGVQPHVQVWLFLIVGIAVACALLAEGIAPRSGRYLPVAFVPLFLLLVLGTLQLVPLARRSGAAVSPKANAMRLSLADEANPSDAALVKKLQLPPPRARQPVSLYPASTRHDLAMLTLAASVFACGAVLFRSSRAVLWLAMAVAINGAALAFFGFVQKLSWNGMLYWTVPLREGGAPFASFVNRNNAGGYLNLCLACALGLMFWAVSRNAPASQNKFASTGYRSGYRLARAWWHFSDWSRYVTPWTISTVAICGTIVAGVLASLSRGALLAMVGALLVTALLVAVAQGRKVLGRIILLSLGCTAGVFLVFWVGFEGQIADRASTLLDTQKAAASRLSLWQQSLTSVPDFWATGSGLGTYRYVYAPYQSDPAGVWYYHAENDYIEMLIEGGVVGLALSLAGLALVGLAAFRLLSEQNGSSWGYFAVAGMFALASQAIHGLTDFGLYIPANMLLFALLCGAVCGAAARFSETPWSLTRLAFFGHRLSIPVSLAVLLVAVTWAGWENHRAAAVATRVGRSFWTDDEPPAKAERIEKAIARLEQAVEGRPDDSDGHLHLARLWTQLSRVRSFEQLGGHEASAPEAAKLWDSTSMVAFHGIAHRMALQDDRDRLEQLRDLQGVRRFLLPALRHLVLARRACPILPETHVRLGEISLVRADLAADQVHLERAKSLLAGHPDLLYRCGVLELQAGRLETACASWRTSLAGSDRYLPRILAAAGEQISLWHLVHSVLPESPSELLRLARYDRHVQKQPALRDMLIERADQLSDQLELPDDERSHIRGAICLMRDDYEQAVRHLQQAVEARWDENEWRYDLALALKRGARLDEARQQARLCAQMSPGNPRYRVLLTEIHREQIEGEVNLQEVWLRELFSLCWPMRRNYTRRLQRVY